VNEYIDQNGALTKAGLDFESHISKLLRSVVAENPGICPVSFSYITNEVISAIATDMILDHQCRTPCTEPQLPSLIALTFCHVRGGAA
jgi:hypothetical protein